MNADIIIECAQREIAKLRAFLGPQVDPQSALLPVLHAIQHEFGHIVPEALPIVAEELNVSQADVRGVVSFYHDFRLEPAGRRTLKLCGAEACQAMGADRLAVHMKDNHRLEPGQTSPDASLTLEFVYCLGNCALAPAAMLGNQLVGRVNEERLDQWIRGKKS